MMAAWKDGLHQLCFLKFSLYSDLNPLLKPHKPLPVEQKCVCDEGIPFHVTAFHVTLQIQTVLLCIHVMHANHLVSVQAQAVPDPFSLILY